MTCVKNFLRENKFIFLMLGVAVIYVAVLRGVFGIYPATLEMLAIVFAVIQFDLFRRQKMAAFIFNIINCALLIIWFSSIGLYGQVTLRSVFILLNLVGLYLWLRPKILDKKELQPTWLPNIIRAPIYLAVILFVLFVFFRYGLITSMDWAYTVCAAVGNVMIAKKKIDAWVIWLITDLIGIPLFLMTGSWMYLLITVFMIGIEIAALKSWRQKNEQ